MKKQLKTCLCAALALLVGLSGVGCGKNVPGASAPASSSAATGLNADPSSLPLTKDKVTLRFAVVRGANNTVPYSEMPVIRDFEEKSNVHIEWEEIDA